jgi:amino-acid N-acetyltransferase
MDGNVTHGPVDIRRATSDDLDSVEALLGGAGLPLAGVREFIDDFFVADAMNTIVGSAGIETHGDYALLRSAVVSRALQGRGIGKRLVDAVIADAKRRGISALYLLTTTAGEYFPSFGFERVDRSSVPVELEESAEFQGACPASATVMRKVLASAKHVARL